MNILSVLVTLIFYFQVGIGDNTNYMGFQPDPSTLAHKCLPVDIELNSTGRFYLENANKKDLMLELIQYGAHCNNVDELVDSSGKQIDFYYVPSFGGATMDAAQSRTAQQYENDKLARLSSSYTLIRICCLIVP